MSKRKIRKVRHVFNAARMIDVLIVEPEKTPRRARIRANLDSYQSIVGGLIDFVCPLDFNDDAILVINDEGKLWGLPWNRSLRFENGEPFDVLAGTFFIAKDGSEGLESLTDEQIEYYEKYYYEPEHFEGTPSYARFGCEFIPFDLLSMN